MHLTTSLLATLLALAPLAHAADYAQVLTRARPDMPLAHPIATTDIAPPPLSLPAMVIAIGVWIIELISFPQ